MTTLFDDPQFADLIFGSQKTENKTNDNNNQNSTDSFKHYNSKDFKITDNGSKVIKTSPWNYRTVYGAETTYAVYGIYEWKLKVNKLSNGCCFIGIDESTHLHKDKEFSNASGSMHYCYCGKNGKKIDPNGKSSKFLKGCKDGDIITVRINLNSKWIGFGINSNSKVTTAFDGLKTNKYSLAISLAYSNDSISILSFKKYNLPESKSNDLPFETSKLITQKHQLMKAEKQRFPLNEMQQLQQKIIHLKKETQTMRNERDSVQKRNLNVQKENQTFKQQINVLKNQNEKFIAQIKESESTIKQMTQQNNLLKTNNDRLMRDSVAQQTRITKLTVAKLEKEEKESENKDNTCIVGVKGEEIKTDLQLLEFQLSTFNNIYNKDKIFDMFNKSSEMLSVDNEMNKLDLQLKSFGKYFMDIKSYIVTLTTPNINEYKQWNINTMIQWICMLENGRYKKYSNILRKGFKSDGIDTGDCLPDLDVVVLRSEPFGITNFKDRRDLVNHFKSLKSNPQQINENFIADEGAVTQYH